MSARRNRTKLKTIVLGALFGFLLIGFSLQSDKTHAAIAIKPVLSFDHSAPVVQIQEGGFLRRMFRGNRTKRKPRRLFRFDRSKRQQAPEVKQTQPKRKRAPQPQTVAKAPDVKQVDKNPDARRILVIGDFFAASLGTGLAESFAQDRTVAIDTATNNASGFVRYDNFDWDKRLAKVLDDADLGRRADLIVVMMGGNDRQFFRAPTRISLDTDAWRAQYKKNVESFAAQIADTDLPVIWVGMPPVRGPKTSAHLSNLTGVFKSAAEGIEGRYVDIWDAFANDQGAYDANGPDINGQQTLLRRNDGFGLTKAGREKLTFFVKRQVDRFFSGSGAIAGTPGGVVVTEDGPVIPLSGFALEDSIALLGGVPLIGPPMDPGKPWEEVSNAYNVLIRGVAQSAPATRVDNFTWPPQTN
ncbi:MAG: DUF459 domain-containing protein [Hyphomicrobiales bacterium]